MLYRTYQKLVEARRIFWIPTHHLFSLRDYWIWMYWLSFVSWALRGLIVNEFDSGKYNEIVPGTGQTEGELIVSAISSD